MYLQICRGIYELMQPMHGDASQYVKSLDIDYFYSQTDEYKMEAIEGHQPHNKDEIELRVGDIVVLFENKQRNGFVKGYGRNNRTGKTGLFLSYKAKRTLKQVKLPTYSPDSNPNKTSDIT